MLKVCIGSKTDSSTGEILNVILGIHDNMFCVFSCKKFEFMGESSVTIGLVNEVLNMWCSILPSPLFLRETLYSWILLPGHRKGGDHINIRCVAFLVRKGLGNIGWPVKFWLWVNKNQVWFPGTLLAKHCMHAVGGIVTVTELTEPLNK